jgi:glycosyltransferase involved in cell wall biosynthesis
MKISFVVPAHNEEARIETGLKAIQQEIARFQKERSNIEFEVIVVNNASHDNTKEVALRVEGVQVVDEHKKGLTQARHAGFVASTGELVANIDADVLLPKGWLSTVVKAFEKDPELVALSGPFIYYDLSVFSRALARVFYFFAYLLYLFNRFILRVGSMVQGGNFVLRRKALVEAGGYDTSITFYGEDTDVASRMHKVGKVRWTFRLPVYASGRRIKGEGIVIISMRYTANYFWVTFFGKPFSGQDKHIHHE